MDSAGGAEAPKAHPLNLPLSMKAGKSQGPDMIHPRILKETSSQIIEPLTKLFRQSLDEAKLPEDWKKANVTALFKSGERK